MKSLNKNYVGKISRRNFKPEICEEDSDFDNSLLKECESDCLITFNVSQFEKAPTPSPPPQPQPQVVDEQQQQQQQENLEEDKEQDVASSKFQSILSWFKSHQPGTLVVGDDGENDLSTVDEQQQFKMLNEQKKKCMMHSFMRLKASIYYRTIVHLLFITGIMLIIFFIAILIVRIYKRRQALRYYSANMKIATIGASFNEATEKNSKDFLFRSSSLKSSYAQAYSPSHPAPPPAYTQIAATEQVNDDDEKKSLPDYEATK